MADKNTIYRGEIRRAEAVIEKINNCIVMYSLTDDGFKTIAAYLTQEAKVIRDEVCNIKGRLEILYKGLDKTSNRRKVYKELLDLCDEFLSATKSKDK